MSDRYRISANGFHYPQPPTGTDPTSRLTELHHLYIQDRPESRTWEYRTEVLGLAKQLLGDFKRWHEQQLGGTLYEYQHKLIDDTIRYVATGQRRTSVRVLGELIMGSTRTTARLTMSDGGDNPMGIMGVRTTSELLAKWCTHRNGFIDMLCTLYVFFGISRETSPEH